MNGYYIHRILAINNYWSLPARHDTFIIKIPSQSCAIAYAYAA